MKKQDIEFLKALQHEMLTQDNCGQASPRFWVVGQTEREYGIDEDYGYDGMEIICSHDGDEVGESLKDLYEWIKEDDYDIDINYDEEYEIIVIDGHGFEDIESAIGYLVNENYIDDLEQVAYREIFKIKEDTFFLTLEECKKHIEANKHHYNNTVQPYAMTAWRSPQVKRLYEILENTDWDKGN